MEGTEERKEENENEDEEAPLTIRTMRDDDTDDCNKHEIHSETRQGNGGRNSSVSIA